MGHVTILAGWVFWRSGTECGSESRAVSMEPRLSGNDVSGNDVSGNDVSGNDVRAEMTSAEMTTETGSEAKIILFTAAILDLQSPYKVSYCGHE